MRYLSILGPAPAGDGDSFIPVILSEAGGPHILAPATSLDGALFAARRALGAADDVLADDSVGPQASRAGWRVGTLPEPARFLLAAAAVAINSREALTKLTDPRLLLELLTATVAFARAKPWRRFLNDQTLPARATGPGGGDIECTVLGEGGEQYGLVVYDARGGHERILQLADVYAFGAALLVDSTVCLLDFTDDFVARAMKAAFGEALSVTLMRIQKGRRQPLRPDDARRLAATLRAVAQVADDGATGLGVCEAGRRVEVTVDASRIPQAGVLPSFGELPASVRAADDEPRPHPLHALDRDVMSKLVAFAKAHVPGFVLPVGSPAGDLDAFLATTLQPFDGRTVLERFLADGAPGPVVREWLEKKARATVSLWEVEATSFVGEVALVDLLTGRRVVVYDVATARQVRYRDALCAAVVDAGNTRLFAAGHPRTLWPNLSHAVARAIAAAPRPAGAFAAARALVDAWTRESENPGLLPSIGLGLRTTDGEVFAPGADTFTFDKKARRQVEAALDALPGFHRTEAHTWCWTKRGNARHPGWWRTTLGEVTMDGATLRVTASSIERLNRARALIEGALPGVVRHAGRTTEPFFADTLGLDAEIDSQPVPVGPWNALQALAQALASAADAASGAEACARVHTQACMLERDEGRLADEAPDGSLPHPPIALAFRRITGVASDGHFVGPDELWAAMGAGFRLSTSLQALVAPLRFDFAGDATERFRDNVRLGWAVWNAVRETDDDDEAVRRARRQLGLEGDLRPAAGRSPRKRRSRQSEPLAPELERADNAALVEEALPWAVRQARGLAWDRRVIRGLFFEERDDGEGYLEALWSMPAELDERLRALGYRQGLLPLTSYDETFDPLDNPFAWRAVAPAWRREVLAQWYREHAENFRGDFAAQVDAHAAVLDAVTADTAPGLRDAWRELRRAGLDDDEVALVLAHAVRTTPELDLSRPGPAFDAALRRVVDEERRRARA